METIPQVIERLDELTHDNRKRLSRRGYFSAMYRAMTARVLVGVETGRFQAPERLSRLCVVFARFYFEALEQPTKPWRVAFSAEDHDRVAILQHLLLGMNAHINLDLPQAVEETGGDLDEVYLHDYNVINDIIEELSDEVEGAVGKHSPGLASLDTKLGRFDEGLFNWSAQQARKGAWQCALLLRSTGPGVLPLMANNAAFLGRLILSVRADGRIGETDYQAPERIPEIIDDIVVL